MDFPFDGLVAGIDEAGRGAIAGPVTAAVVILSKNHDIKTIDDSKRLTPSKREKTRKIIEKQALYWSVAHVGVDEIDLQNILKATFLAMHQAIGQLKINPDLLLVDGNRFLPYKDLKYECIVKGDQKYKLIAAASILAKTHRDLLMKNLHQQHPEYHWLQNKGYPTPQHKIAVKKNGLSPWHRKSFQCT
ncbi:MAG: ribonuclease HII [Flavobacteriaceae bacterium]|nr:ribonuclease HII [Flavobacteriaceae bacterium]MCY4217431.1 ribonuclease HII [Flavobacteriaceae bacterium]